MYQIRAYEAFQREATLHRMKIERTELDWEAAAVSFDHRRFLVKYVRGGVDFW
jgi:hypothetical protein